MYTNDYYAALDVNVEGVVNVVAASTTNSPRLNPIDGDRRTVLAAATSLTRAREQSTLSYSLRLECKGPVLGVIPDPTGFHDTVVEGHILCLSEVTSPKPSPTRASSKIHSRGL